MKRLTEILESQNNDREISNKIAICAESLLIEVIYDG